MDYIKPEVYVRLTRGKLKEGDILYCLRGSLGKYGIVHKYFGEGAIASSLVIIRTKSAVVTRDYLLSYLGSYLCSQMIETWAGGAAQPNLGVQDLSKFLFPLPPLPEQHAIAAALSDADALIASLDRLIAKKRDMKQAAMQELLTGKRRLPGFSGEWEVKRLGEVFAVSAGGDFNPSCSSSIQDENHPYPIYSNAITGGGLYGYCSYNDHPENSITVTARGSLGCANFRNHKFTAIGRVLVLVAKEQADGRFFSEYINNKIEFVIESTGVPQLTAPQISKYSVPVPPLPEQTAIAAILSDMDAEIAAMEQKRDKTRLLKQGMMQKLLTGRIRLV